MAEIAGKKRKKTTFKNAYKIGLRSRVQIKPRQNLFFSMTTPKFNNIFQTCRSHYVLETMQI